MDLGTYEVPEGVDILGRYDAEFAKILTKDALKFVAELQRQFRSDIKHALESRREAKKKYNEGTLPGFDPATSHIRDQEWLCAPVPPAAADRKVEITGPVDRKMVINALNSAAKVFMADLEDALSPTWENLISGQVNLKDAVDGTISFHDKVRNRVYKLNDQTAKLFVRPRGWHLPEAHILIDGEPATGCLVDFGLYFYHNHSAFRRTQGAGFGPFFYLPKMEHSREAKIWNSVFEKAEDVAGIERGSIRATVLIETLPAVFQMDEILYELKEHSVGLNCGRWDYIFSYVKTFQTHPDRLLPDRVQVGMTQHFMKSYSDLLIRTCHRRGVHAMGGMAAQIPIKDDPVANEAALELVRKDKLREVKAGHDGTWAAHPGLIPSCMEVFNNNMGNAPNQIDTVKRDDAANLTEQDLLQIPTGTRTMEGLRLNTRVGIQYLAAWLSGDVDALDDNVESFLSNDGGDGGNLYGTVKQSPAEQQKESSKGFTFAEVGCRRTRNSKVTCCHFSSDGKWLASAGDDMKVDIWNMDTLETESTPAEHKSVITDVRFRPNSSQLATASTDKSVRLWDTTNPSRCLQEYSGHSSAIMSLDFHPKKTELFCFCDGENEIRYWNINSSTCTRVTKGVSAQVRFQPRLGRYLAAASDKGVSIFDVESDTQIYTLQGHPEPVSYICWDGNGDALASVSSNLVKVWSLTSGGECIHEFSSPGNQFHSCVFHPSYSTLLVVGGISSLELWNMTENKSMTITTHENVISALAQSSVTGMVASASHDNYVKLWK